MSLSSCDLTLLHDNDSDKDNIGYKQTVKDAEVNAIVETPYDGDSEMNYSGPEEVALKREVVTDEDTSAVVVPMNSSVAEPISNHNLSWNLRLIISNLYMKIEDRLPMARVPKCLHNTSQCVARHRCAMLPDAPDIGLTQDLRSNLHRQNYDTYIDILETMVLQSVYPDEAVFDQLFDLIMTLNSKCASVNEVRRTYSNVLRIFDLLLDAFPPCWTALRPYYLNFLGVDGNTSDRPQKLQLLINLLEGCMSKCSDTELTQLTAYYEPFVHDYSDEDNLDMLPDDVFQKHVQDYDWQSGKQWLEEFQSMSPAVQLARVCDALNIICRVLESEFFAWLDNCRLQQTESDIFQEDTKPFVFIIFGITEDKRLTSLTRKLLRLFSRAAAMSLYPDRMRILERLLSLLMEASNTAELKYTNGLLIYPHIGSQTNRLISELFKIFKAENPADLKTYIRIIPLMSQPYVRFKFADHFLRLFYYSNEEFGPEKVCKELKLKHWLKYKPRSEIEESDHEQLSREDYLMIMLNTLKDYCKWLNIRACWKYIKTKIPVQKLQASTSSPLATPVGVVTGGVGKIFMLDEMEKEAHTWKHRIKLNVNLTRPKVNLPVARISVNSMAERYGNDIRQLRYLRRILLEAARFVDVTAWLIYINDFLGEDEPRK